MLEWRQLSGTHSKLQTTKLQSRGFNELIHHREFNRCVLLLYR